MIEALPCKICTGRATDMGPVNFHKNCAGVKLAGDEYSAPAIHYYRCTHCGLIFTPNFDSWSSAKFQREIYNTDYRLVDPEYYSGARALRNATQVKQLFPKETICLDYGDGDGKLAEILRGNGISAHHFDPMNESLASVPEYAFDLVTCFEVLEHSVYPKAVVKRIKSCLKPNGIVFFSTHTLPQMDDILNWWYVAPRNGHITIFSMKALHILWNSIGFNMVSLNPNRHFAQRKIV